MSASFRNKRVSVSTRELNYVHTTPTTQHTTTHLLVVADLFDQLLQGHLVPILVEVPLRRHPGVVYEEVCVRREPRHHAGSVIVQPGGTNGWGGRVQHQHFEREGRKQGGREGGKEGQRGDDLAIYSQATIFTAWGDSTDGCITANRMGGEGIVMLFYSSLTRSRLRSSMDRSNAKGPHISLSPSLTRSLSQYLSPPPPFLSPYIPLASFPLSLSPPPALCACRWLSRSIYLPMYLSITSSYWRAFSDVGSTGRKEARAASLCPSINQSMYLSIDRYIYRYICISIYLSILYLSSIDLFIYLSIYLHTYLSIYLHIYLSMYLSIYLFIDLSIHLSIERSIYRSINQSTCQHFFSSHR